MTSSPTRLANLRDVSHTSPRLARGVLLRSDAPLHGDDHTGYDVTWPPRTVIDLRDSAERTDGHPLAASAAVVSLELLGGAALDVDRMPSTLDDLYLGMLERPGAGRLVAAVEAIATGETPVLVHCAAGKDRTGMTVALALSLAGIDRAAIIADYVRTGDVMLGVNARLAATRSTLIDPQKLASLPAALGTAPPEAITPVLDAWANREGGVESWYSAHGGSATALAALRERLLID